MPAPDLNWEHLDVVITGTGMASELARLLKGTPGLSVRTGTGATGWDGAEVIIGFQFPAGSLSSIRSLRWLHLTGTGIDHVRSAGLSSRTLVTTSASVPVTAVAEYAMAGLLMMIKDLSGLAGAGPRQPDEWFGSTATLLEGSTVGVAGAGRIGRAILARASAFGARTIAITRLGSPAVTEAMRTVGAGQLAAVAPEIDHLLCALPGTPATRGLVSAAVLAALPRHATVVNVGRAATIDVSALHAALIAGQLRGAFVDVHETEPLPPDDPAWRVPRLIISPHRAFSFPDEPRRVAEVFLANLDDLRHGRVPRDAVRWQSG